MEIGSELKNARIKRGLTQEKVAEEIGVSRQSISNWENSRLYPDIVSVIRLSDLYSVSLDELLKEDKKMINHLDESTNTVRSRRRLAAADRDRRLSADLDVLRGLVPGVLRFRVLDGERERAIRSRYFM